MTVFEKIKKRDGRLVEFDSAKITAAIAKAGQATGEFGEREARKLTLRVLTLAHDIRLEATPEVEEIQDIVERVLLDSPFYKTAKAYILYREQHAQIRKIATKAHIDLVEHYISKLDWKIKENSNMCYSLQGLNNYISSDVTAEYWLNRIYPPEIRDAHKKGDLHIHDLSLLSVYCRLGSDGSAAERFQRRGGQGGKCPPQTSAFRPGTDRQFFLHPSGRSRGGPGPLQFRYLAGALCPL
jgi:ribonucleoside-triphosphate reductase